MAAFFCNFTAMIHLTQSTTNIMTCEAQSLNTTGFFLWRFVSSQYETEHLIYIQPLFSNDRFSKFELILPTDINLSKIGKYHYYVYNGDGNSTDYTTMSLLENGQIDLK